MGSHNKKRHLEKIANIILFLGLVCSLGILLYAMTNIDPHLPDNMNKYILVSLFACVVFIVCLCSSANVKVNGTLFFLSVLSVVYLTELALTVFPSLPPSTIRNLHRMDIAQRAGVHYDIRTKLEVIKDYERKGRKVYPSFNSSVFLKSDGLSSNGRLIFPLGSISKKTTIYCNENGEYILYDSDEHGFNNPQGIYSRTPIDILIVGDSFAQGACVAPDQTLANWLRKYHQSVISVASGGNGPLTELATLTEYGKPLQPKVVLWIYFEGNDLRDLLKERRSLFLKKYFEDDFSQGLIFQQETIDALLEKMAKIKEREAKNLHRYEPLLSARTFTKIIKLFHLRQRIGIDDPLPSSIPSLLSQFRLTMETAKERTTSMGSTLYFVYLPSWDRYEEPQNQPDLFERQKVLSIVQSLDIPIIDIDPLFRDHPDPKSLFPFRVSGHYTGDGYRLVAQKIQSFLKETMLHH